MEMKIAPLVLDQVPVVGLNNELRYETGAVPGLPKAAHGSLFAEL